MAFAGCREPAADGWTTVGERIPYDFAVLLPSVGPLEAGSTRVGVKASDCGQCHQAIYTEWKASTHASAMRDVQYYAELSKDSSPRWLCLNCHAPVQNQRRWLIDADTRLRADPLDVSGLVKTPNPAFDPVMQREGVTCATCHVRAEGGRSYVVAATASGRAPHPVRADRAGLRNICVRCHSPGEGSISPLFWCWFETAQESAAAGVKEDCADCHMPAVERPIVAGAPPRPNRHHYWAGGGVPKTFDGYDSLLDRGYEPGLDLTARLDGGELVVELANTRGGHHVTSADPERFVLVRVEVEDPLGRPMVVATRRYGQRWDWGRLEPEVRPARRVGDDRLPAGQRRSWRVPLPHARRKIVVRAAHVRLLPQNARHMKTSRIPSELTAIWPEVSVKVARLEDHYPLMTWFAQVSTEDGRRWKAAPLAELLEASKALRGAPLETYEALLEVRRSRIVR